MLNTKVKDFMQRKLPNITPDTEMTTAIAELQKFKLLGAPVFDKDKCLVGFIQIFKMKTKLSETFNKYSKIISFNAINQTSGYQLYVRILNCYNCYTIFIFLQLKW